MLSAQLRTAWLSWLVPAFCAGALVAAVDVWRMVAAGADVATCLALIALCVAASMTLAALSRGVLWVAARVDALIVRLAPAGAARTASARETAVLATLLAALAIPLGRELFSGAGMQRAGLATLGPLLFPFAVLAVAAAALAALRRAVTRGDRTRRVAALALALAALGLLAAERFSLVGLYAYLHALAAFAALALLTLAGALLRAPRAEDALPGALLLAASALGLAIVAASFPHDNRARMLLVEQRPIAAHVMNALAAAVDLDRDGASLLFAGGECDDRDPRVHPGALDVAQNGIDEDCDGRDAAAPFTRRPYAGDRAAAQRVARAARERTTVVLVIDALRADRVGDARFPQLARLAQQSLDFTHAFAPATSTGRSIPAMVTGRHAPRASDLSVFDRLAGAGTRSALAAPDVVLAMISGAKQVRGARAYPLLRGVSAHALVPTGYGADKTWGGGVTRSTDAQVTDAAIRLLDAAEPPKLLWVHYFDLHQWRHLEGLSGDPNTRYDAVLARTDAQLARWLARADSINIVLVADHGEGLGDHDFAYHTLYLWRELVRVPLLVRVPGIAARRIDLPVTLVDLAPTLLDLVGQPAGGDRPFSLLALTGTRAAQQNPSAHFLALERLQVSLVRDRYRVILDLETRGVWLFDVVADPDERHNLAAREPERVASMVRELTALHAAARSGESSW